MTSRPTRTPQPPPTSPDPERAEQIGTESPEGLPAHPEAGPRTIGLLLTSAVVAFLSIAVVLAAFISPVAGIAVGGLTLAMFLANPAVWAAILRADERRALLPKAPDRHERKRSSSVMRDQSDGR